ncbi:MAG: hypothetical protein KGJ13_03670 [Patescibacteria group bacterium]|nr:hypothetical protein [Patescibacteria group bacterium]
MRDRACGVSILHSSATAEDGRYSPATAKAGIPGGVLHTSPEPDLADALQRETIKPNNTSVAFAT